MDTATTTSLSVERSRALVVGVGALGCQAAVSLAASGISELTLIDDDRVELSNLQRQILFDDADIGRPKAIAAALNLRALASSSTIAARVERVTPRNVTAFVAAHDVTIDATDDPDVKYLLNHAAIETGQPLVYGGVARTGGLALAVRPRQSACLACAFPPLATQGNESCAALGILAPVAGAIGALQAHLAVRLLEKTETVAGLLYIYETRARRWRTMRFERDPQCPSCSPASRHAA